MANNKLTNSLRNSIAAENQKIATTSHSKHTTAPTATAEVTSSAAKTSPNPVAKAPAKRVIAKHVVTKTQKSASTRTKAENSHTSPTSNKITTGIKLPENFATALTHKKLHQIIETHYHLCETYLENLEKVNDSLHDYFNQLVEINNLSALVKLNLSYISAAPIRIQEMLAQNKSVFSDFFKFDKPEEK